MKRLMIPVAVVALLAAACSSVPAAEPSTTETFAPMELTTTSVVETTVAPETTTTLTTSTTQASVVEPPVVETIPSDGDVVDTYIVGFVGRSETAVGVLVNGDPADAESLDVDARGTFAVELPSDIGENDVVIEAIDEDGQKTIVTTSYVFAPEDGWIEAIGDSVMLGSKEELEKRIGSGTVDATVSRQFHDAPGLVRDLLAREVPPQVIIVALGTNGAVQARHFDELMEIAADVPLMVFVNVHVPTRNWEATSNREIAAGVERYDNAVLVDWFTATEDRSELFAADNVHPTQAGRVIYAELVAETIYPNWEPLDG